MSNKHLISLCVAAATTLLGACSESITDEPTEPGTPLQIASVSIVPEQADTRATGDTQLGIYDVIGLFQYKADGGMTNLRQYQYTHTGSSWATDSPLYIGHQESKVYAYYPYQADVNPTNIPMNLQKLLNEGDGDKSLAYSEAVPLRKSTLTNPVALSLKHAYSKMVIKVKTGDAAMAGAQVSQLILTGHPTKARLNLYATTDAERYKVTEEGLFIYPGGTTLEATGTAYTLVSLLMPPDGGGKYKMGYTLNVNGITMTGASALPLLKANQSCSITLNISARDVKVEQVTFEPWTKKTEDAEI